MFYGIRAIDYLKRARQRLDDATHESLFYAAFELRCGVQARLSEYVRAQKETSAKKKGDWRIPKLARDLEEAFRTGDKVIRLTLTPEGTGGEGLLLQYIPVHSIIQQMAGQLGNVLHAMKPEGKYDDVWWEEMRRFLEMMYEGLRLATLGTLLAPPLKNRKTGQIHLAFTVEGEAELERHQKFFNETGGKFKMSVTYADGSRSGPHTL